MQDKGQIGQRKIFKDYKEMYEVAAECQKTYSWVTTIHGRALKHVQEILKGRKVNDGKAD